MAEWSDGVSETRIWQCPPAAVSEDKKIGWLNETTEEGEAWLKTQRGYKQGGYRRALDVISGAETLNVTASYRSHVNPNRLKRNIREVVGTLAKLRPMWGYHSDNASFKPQAEMMNKVTQAWYLRAFADRSIKEALQYAAATGRGWVVPMYRREMYGTGRGDLKLFTYGAPSILPFQLPSSNDFQAAYAVTILDMMPVAMAHGMFPAFQSRLRPSSSRYWYANDGIRRASEGNILQRIFGKSQRSSASSELSDLLVPVRRTYVIDLTINTTKQEIPMGEPGSSWAYTVPYIGQDILVGHDPKSGSPLYRKANENDARLYPQRRLLISTDQVCMYDGPGFDWHGMFPGVSFCLDDYPWEPNGFSLVHDGFEINEAIKQIARGNMDKAAVQLDMPLAYDSNATSSREAKAFDPMMPRGRVGFDGSALDGEPFRPVVPPEVIKITPESMAMIQYLEGALDSQMAVHDAMALAKMRSLTSLDDVDKILEAMGPIIEDMSRSMEPPMRDLGVMVKYNILQYYTTPRIMQVVGPDGITPVVFDYDPTSIVPSHLPGDDVDKPSPTEKIKRARIFADNLEFFILPNSIHEMSQMANKLGFIQLKKAGVKMDSQTIAEAWNVPNWGKLDGSTVLERFQSEQEMDLQYAARLHQEAEGLGLIPPTPPPATAPGGPPGAPGPGGTAPEGRPPSGQAAPALRSKDGGARSTITESR